MKTDTTNTGEGALADFTSFPKQTKFRRPGEIGNCFQYCVAAVLGLPPEEVPHFLEIAVGNNSNMFFDIQKWLNARDMWLLETTHISFYRDGEMSTPLFIACGPSPRSQTMGQHHAVVMQDYKMVYDPHPDETGLTAIKDYYLIFKPAA